jgi:serine-type D-Ala-D-Ala carboxypeptidase/endopeptidase (penicillin-binding protein 4)
MRSQIFKRIILLLILVAAGCAKHVPGTFKAPPVPRDTVRELRLQLDHLFGNPEFSNAFWGVAIQSIDSGEILYEQNSGKLLMPASNMKILTGIAALKKLGPDFVYETRIATENDIQEGKLNGNLIVTGNGDPTISVDVLNQWAAQLKAGGLNEINGDIIGDDSAFDDERLGFGWSWDDLPYYYATETTALQLAENAITVTLIAGEAGLPVTVQKEPNTSYIQVVQNVQVQPDAQPSVKWIYKPESRTVYASGTLPSGGEDYGSFSISNPSEYFVHCLKEKLEENGIEVHGSSHVKHWDTLSLPVRITRKSPPLKEILSVLLKRSQNLYAETLLKTLGSGKTADGIGVVETTLEEMGVPPNSIVMLDGSGLSRYNYVTPNALLTCLRKIYLDDPAQIFYNALPIAGVDGTLKSRMKESAAENNVRAKTGSISNVRSLSGYVRTRDGEMLVFSILANNFNAPSETANAIQDQAVELLANFMRSN